ncbi:MAG: hypothetical protein HC831_08565 [Chloroflexia bacterium]|nr:hypothetical protein [Chloroflexia bacterium]
MVEKTISNEESVKEEEFEVFVKSHNLFLRNYKSNSITQLSYDGETYYSFKANIDYNYTNENLDCDTLIKQADVLWSPNSNYFWLFDPMQEKFLIIGQLTQLNLLDLH